MKLSKIKFILPLFIAIFFSINSMENDDPIRNSLDDHIKQAVNELPASSQEGVNLVKDFLNEIRRQLFSSSENLNSIGNILESLQSIKNFILTPEYQAQKFISTTYQTEITLIRFVQLFIDPIIDIAKKEISKSDFTNIIPVGLLNADPKIAINNRCFMNAAIQCLYALKDLNAILVNSKESKKYLPNSIAQNYVDLVLKMKESRNKINALDFSLQIWNAMEINPSSPGDAGELIGLLLNHLIYSDACDFMEHKQIKDVIGFELISLRLIGNIPNIKLEELAQKQTIFKLLINNHPEIKTLTLPQFVEKQTNYQAMLTNYPELFSILEESNIARSYFSKLLPTGKQQNAITKKQQQILNLPLRSNHKNIIQCLDSFFEVDETYQNNNLLNQFSKYVYRIDGVRKNFIISLNRNTYNFANNSAIRIETQISFNLNNLDISKYCENKTYNKYSLVACLMHSGNSSTNGGHYTAYTKHGSKWYFCNDSEIKPITLKEMEDISKRGYGTDKHHLPIMLFYQQN